MKSAALSLVSLFVTFIIGCTPTSLGSSDSATLSLLLAEYPVRHDATCSSVLARLLAATTASGSEPMRIILIDSSSPMALTPQPTVIVVSTGLLRAFEAEGEAFFTMAHEAAHTELGHHRSSSIFSWLQPTLTRKEMELEADALALKRLARAGYPTSDALAALKKAYNLSSSIEESSSSEYPLLSERVSALVPQLALLAPRNFARTVGHREYQECRATLLLTADNPLVTPPDS
jgi:Zn-dependent protease with chaperone function